MKILDIFPAEPNKVSENPIWRCVAPDSKPEEISSLIGQTERERAAIYDRISRLTTSRGDVRSRIKWVPKKKTTRFSDGSIPVVYFSEDPKTATTECFYWAYRGLSNTSSLGDFSLKLLVFSVAFNGTYRDLTPFTPPCVDMVHPDDYTCCNNLGKLAFDEGGALDAIRVLSARVKSGVNRPVFRQDHVGVVEETFGVSVYVRSGQKRAMLRGAGFNVEAEDIYSLVLSTE